MVVRPPFAVTAILAAGVVDVRACVECGPAWFRSAPLDSLSELGLDAKSQVVTVRIHERRAWRPVHWTEGGDPSACWHVIYREQPTLRRRLDPLHRAWRYQPRLH